MKYKRTLWDKFKFTIIKDSIMIAKAKVIQHGHNAINYAVNKEQAEIVRLNFLPQDITPDAMWQRMMTHQKLHEYKYNSRRPLKNNLIRIEVSPRPEESQGWTIGDWDKLAKDFLEAFDAIDLSHKSKRISAKSTSLSNSQYVVALHHDSKSGIPHLHIDANRIDMEGNINDAHFIYERAMEAAKLINQKRGWRQATHYSFRNKMKLSMDCNAILSSMKSFSIDDFFKLLAENGYEIRQQRDCRNKVRGYSVKMGSSIYKSSEIGTGRRYMPSKLEATWKELHSIIEHEPVKQSVSISLTASGSFNKSYDESSKKESIGNLSPTSSQTSSVLSGETCKYNFTIDEKTHTAEISKKIDDFIRSEIESNQGAWTLTEETIDRIQRVAVALFVGYIDAALTMSESYGGGGSVSSNWGKDEDDDWLWARKCVQKAMWLCKPRMRYGRGR